MRNDQKSIIAMVIVTIIAISVCIATVIVMQRKPEQSIVIKPTVIELKKKVPEKQKTEREHPLISVENSKEEKGDDAEEWKEAGAELANFFQSSKFKEMMMRRMTARTKAYLKELFEKYGIDEKTQGEIASVISESQAQFFSEIMASGGMRGNIDDATREKLISIQEEAENQIIDLSSTAFLADAKDKRSREMRENYLNRLDRNLKSDKMSDDQRAAMDQLYSENQISDSERFTLSPDEIKQRQQGMDNGAKDILSASQYKNYKRSSGNIFGRRASGRRRF